MRGPAAATTCGCSCRTASTDVDARDVRRSAARICSAGDVARREHVGDDPGRDRGDRCPTAPRCASTSRPSCPAGCWLVEARRPIGGTTAPFTDDLTGADIDARGRRSRAPARPLRRLAAAVARVARTSARRCSTTSPRTASRSATGTRRAAGRSTRTSRSSAPSRAARRCRARRGRSRAELVVDLVRRGVTIDADPAARAACRRSKRTRCRTPSATACPTRPPRT